MGMPFGLIFAIFLIVIFIVIAFIAVGHFLDISRCSSIGNFYDSLQDEVDSVWASQESSEVYEIELPSGIERICFSNLSAEVNNEEDYMLIERYSVYEANVFLVPPEKGCNMPYNNIEHINISEITKNQNPYCVDVSRTLKIEKDFYDKRVLIK